MGAILCRIKIKNITMSLQDSLPSHVFSLTLFPIIHSRPVHLDLISILLFLKHTKNLLSPLSILYFNCCLLFLKQFYPCNPHGCLSTFLFSCQNISEDFHLEHLTYTCNTLPPTPTHTPVTPTVLVFILDLFSFKILIILLCNASVLTRM